MFACEGLAIIGLGYVGLPLAVEFGKIRPVIGFDINKERVAELISGYDATKEVGYEKLSLAKYLKYSTDVDDLKDCDVFIITVPTPVDDAKQPDLSLIISASELVGSVIKKGVIIIYESTVYPGCTEEVCVPILEKTSGMKFNKDFLCGYSPERINPGDKVNTLTTIKKITSGSTKETAEIIDKLYASIITAGTWKASGIKVAEAAKIIENCQRDLNIAFVNELSVIFERIGIDTLEVLEAAGSKWNFLPFRPGMVGGHCIGVDPYYLTYKAEKLGYHPQVILAGRRINDNMGRYVARNIIKLMIKNGIDVAKSTVGIMGVTFKENCPDIRNSKVIDLINELKKWNIKTVVADCWADPKELRQAYGIEIEAIDKINQVDSLIVAVGHEQYRKLTPEKIKQYCCTEQPVLVDVKSIYKREEAISAGFTVFRL